MQSPFVNSSFAANRDKQTNKQKSVYVSFEMTVRKIPVDASRQAPTVRHTLPHSVDCLGPTLLYFFAISEACQHFSISLSLSMCVFVCRRVHCSNRSFLFVMCNATATDTCSFNCFSFAIMICAEWDQRCDWDWVWVRVRSKVRTRVQRTLWTDSPSLSPYFTSTYTQAHIVPHLHVFFSIPFWLLRIKREMYATEHTRASVWTVCLFVYLHWGPIWQPLRYIIEWFFCCRRRHITPFAYIRCYPCEAKRTLSYYLRFGRFNLVNTFDFFQINIENEIEYSKIQMSMEIVRCAVFHVNYVVHFVTV